MARVRPPGAARPRLILVDDHRMFVESLRDWLGTTFDVVGVAYAGHELLALLEHQPADCLLLDVQLPDRHGLDLIPDVLALQPSVRILIVTMFLDRCLADAAFAAGAHGFVPKDAGRDELSRAITDVLAGQRRISPRVRARGHATSLNALRPALQNLTPRQQTVFRLLGEGKSAAEIGRILSVRPSTITFHKHNIQRAPGFESDRALLGYAVLIRGCLEGYAGDAVAARSGAEVPNASADGLGS